MSSNELTAEKRLALEARHTWQRLVELRLDPVRGQFDATHLKEINRRIFQDLPGLGFSEATPGEYRLPVAAGNDWVKTRKLESVGIRLSVAYSPMDSNARSRLEDILESADPAVLSGLSTRAFTAAMGRLYSEVDYIHPFVDGNSRTLREFTRQLAERSGYMLAWERFGQSPAGRDILYIARDRSVNELALPHIQQEATRRAIVLSMDQIEGNQDLPGLLQDIIQPVGEPSLEQQLAAEEGRAVAVPNGPAVSVEQSLEEQLRGQENGGYQVKVAAKTNTGSQQQDHLQEDHYDEPGMD